MQTIIVNQESKTPLLIQEQVPLADKTWFKTGGSARYYCEPTDEFGFAYALEFAQKKNLPVFILGHGANILISDEGFDGLVIKPALEAIEIAEQTETHAILKVGAGLSFDTLIEYCLHHNFLGLEEFSGVPGTVGGATFINIHYYEYLLEQFITGAHIIDKNTQKTYYVPTEWFEFGYDHSKLFENNHVVSHVFFKVKKADDLLIAYAQGRRDEIMRHRFRRYPTARTCGSFFRNFTPEEVANTKAKLIYVAYYLDKLGIKGELRSGKAKISHQHANMLITEPGATSNDVISLARTMQEMVYKEFGILPQAECQLIGFTNPPLLSL